MAVTEESNVRHKSFSYGTGLTWTGGRTGVLSSEEKRPVQVSSPPEFNGEGGNWTPEDLFVATVEMCQMLTFLAIVQKHRLPLVSYQSTARGSLEFIDGAYQFTHIVITPTVVVEEPATEPETLALLREAHKRCLIANSIKATVEVNANIILREAAMTGESPQQNQQTC